MWGACSDPGGIKTNGSSLTKMSLLPETQMHQRLERGLGQLYLMPSNPDEGARKETVGFSNKRPQSKSWLGHWLSLSPVCNSPVRWEYLPHSVELQQNGLHCFHQMCFILYLSHNLGNGGTATWKSGTHSPTDGRHKARPAESAIRALVKVLFHVWDGGSWCSPG